MACDIIEWLKSGIEDFKKKWTTYTGITVIGYLALVVLTVLLGTQVYTSIANMGPTPELGSAILTMLSAAAIWRLLGAIVYLVIYTALLVTATLGEPSVREAFRRVPGVILGVLVTGIVMALAFWIPELLFAYLDSFLGTTFLVYVGKLIGLYLAIRLITSTGRVVFGESITEAIKNAWNTDFVQSLKVLITIVLVSLAGVIVTIVGGLIPVIGVLIALAVALALPGISTAVYMKAVEAVR